MVGAEGFEPPALCSQSTSWHFLSSAMLCFCLLVLSRLRSFFHCSIIMASHRFTWRVPTISPTGFSHDQGARETKDQTPFGDGSRSRPLQHPGDHIMDLSSWPLIRVTHLLL